MKLRYDWNHGTRYCVERDEDNATRQHVLVGFKDKHGRAIGFKVTVGPCKCTTAEGAGGVARFEDDDLPDVIYFSHVQATRDGNPYGAYQDRDYFRTQDEAFEHAAEKVARGTKRYAKQFKKG